MKEREESPSGRKGERKNINPFSLLCNFRKKPRTTKVVKKYNTELAGS